MRSAVVGLASVEPSRYFGTSANESALEVVKSEGLAGLRGLHLSAFSRGLPMK